MATDKLWQQVCDLLKEQVAEAADKLKELLVKTNRERRTVLAELVEFLNDESSEAFCAYGIYTLTCTILRLLEHPGSLSEEDTSQMASFVIEESRHFSSPALVKAVAYCVNVMDSSFKELPLPTKWAEVFGKLVSIVGTRGEIENDDGDQLSGKQYNEQVITEIVRINWNAETIVSLFATLRQMPYMDTHEMNLILEKTRSLFGITEPDSFPAIAHQVLVLAGARFPKEATSLCEEYFRNMEPDNLDDEDADLELLSEKGRALASTVRHFVDIARKSEPLLKHLMNTLKASQYHHSLILSPFTMAIALGLTQIDRVKPAVLDIIKTTVFKACMEVQLSQSNAFYHQCSGGLSEQALISCFTRVLDSTISEFDFMLDGIKDLGVALLAMDPSGGKDVQVAKTQCHMVGDHLLVSLVYRRPSYLTSLVNEFLKRQNSVTNTACFARCLTKVIYPKIHKDHIVIVRELIHYLPLMTVQTATPILKAILPSLQLSVELLSELVTVIRKTVWKTVESRKVSVTVMILLLCNARIFGDIPRSQFSNTQFFKMSQFSSTQMNVLGSPAKNESICHEVLRILKRTFTQQFEVRELLYIELFNVARQNPELLSVLCSHVETHMKKYFETRENVGNGRPRLSMAAMSQFAALSASMEEPLGYFVQCLSFLLIRSRQIYGDPEDDGFGAETPSSVLLCSEIMNGWISDIEKILTEDFYKTFKFKTMDEKSAKQKAEFLVQLLQTVEALIEFLSLGGCPSKSQTLSGLFEKFKSLQAVHKSSDSGSAGGKKKRKTKGNLSLSSIPDDVTDDGDFLVPKAPTLKKVPYRHLVTTENLVQIFTKLYDQEDDFDETANPLGSVKGNKTFEKFLFSILKQKVQSVKQGEGMKERDKEPTAVTGHLATIAGLLWTQSQKMPADPDVILEGDEENWNELRLSLVVDILRCLFLTCANPQLVLSRFLCEPRQTGYDELFVIFFEQFTGCVTVSKKYLQGNRDGKGICDLFGILEVLGNELKTNEASVALPVATSWFTKFLEDDSTIFHDDQLTPEHAEAILKSLVVIVSKAEPMPELFLALAQRSHFVLGDVDDDTSSFNSSDTLWLVTPRTATTVLYQFALYVEITLNNLKGLVGKLSSTILEEETITLRAQVCTQMDFLMRLMTNLVRSAFPVGPWVDVLRRVLAQFFGLMTSITSSFSSSALTTAEVTAGVVDAKAYRQLVKGIGADFRIRAEAMVHHCEKIRREQVGQMDTTRKKGAASAKHGISKDTKAFPALTYAIEKYEQNLLVLSTKSKVRLLDGTRLSAPRDFRISYSTASKRMREVPPQREEVEEESTSSSLPNVTQDPQPPQAGPSSSSGRGKRMRISRSK